MNPIRQITTRPATDLSALESFVKSDLIPYENATCDATAFTPEILSRLFDHGVFHVITPKHATDRTLPVSDLIWVARTLAYGSPSAGATFIGNLLGHSAFVMYAKNTLKESVCARYLGEKTLWAFGMTEGGAGSDLQNIATKAVRVDGGFKLTGEKNFITNATVASHFCVFARLYSKTGADEGISCFYVTADSKGFTRQSSPNKMGWKKASNGTLLFKDVFVPEAHLLGEPGQGLSILTHCLNRSKTLLAATGAGVSQRAIDLVVERLSSTERYGKSLLEQPAIRHQLARMTVKMEAAWLLTCQAASTWDAGLPAVREASMAKLFSGGAATEIASQAMELFGARGYFNDYEVSRLFNDAKAIEIVEGPSLVQELLIAKETLPRAKKSAKEKDPFVIPLADVKRAA